jgi:hypothetical protein
VAGGAIRFEYLEDLPVKSRNSRHLLFLPLPVDREAARAAVELVCTAFPEPGDSTVLLKVHPLTTWAEITGGEEIRLPDHITNASHRGIRDLLLECDTLLYCQTSTCMEALRIGIPVVYLDLFTYLDADYVMDPVPFRWTAGSPRELREVLAEIDGLNDEEYGERQRAGIAYAQRFFGPVTDRVIEWFMADKGRGNAPPS